MLELLLHWHLSHKDSEYLQRIKSQLWRCVICHKHRKPHQTPDPPPLPQLHMCTSISFTITCIDFTGALYVWNNYTEKKVYICIYTCATTLVIHLEVFTDLTVETFLLAFRRFSSHRLLLQVVVSDNESTYMYMVAADKLRELLQSNILTGAFRRKGVQWQFTSEVYPMVWWVVGALFISV